MNRLRHPIRAIREPFGTAGLIVACVALVAALGGTAFAAAKLNSTQKKEVEKIAKKFAGKPGAPGANGTNGTNGSPGAKGDPGAPGVNGSSVVAEPIPTSSTTCKKQGGTEFEVEGSGKAETVCNGTTGFTKTLPSKETETGVWAFNVVNPATGQAFSPISFNIPLAEPLDAEHVEITDLEYPASDRAECEALSEPEKAACEAELAEAEAHCPGSSEAPVAAPGYLCIYTAGSLGVETSHLHPINQEENGVGAGRTGLVVLGTLLPETAFARGPWAVTAP
jgi:hypothetical protein